MNKLSKKAKAEVFKVLLGLPKETVLTVIHTDLVHGSLIRVTVPSAESMLINEHNVRMFNLAAGTNLACEYRIKPNKAQESYPINN